MRLKAVSGIMLILLLIGMLILAFNIQPAEASGTIYIRADGSVDPDTAPISSADNITYTLTDNIIGAVPIETSAIVVERDNIVVDGAGYTVKATGTDFSKGIDLAYRSNVTIKNIKIRDFYYGIYLYHSSNNCISENEMTPNMHACVYGIRLYSHCNNNTISGNNASDNVIGIFLRSYCNNNTVSSNDVHSNLDYGVYLDGSSNNTISENNITNNGWGIILSGSSYNTISGNNITANIGGIEVSSSSDNTINGNNITNNEDGIMLSGSSNITISGNNIIANNEYGIKLSGPSNYNIVCGNKITNNGDGIRLYESSNNTISGNDITNNDNAIYFYFASNNTLRNNDASNNKYNFYIYGSPLSHYIQNIDDSNTVNGKPIYYGVNRRDTTVPLDAGYVALINCTNITAKNLNLANNGQGVLLAFTTNSTVTKNSITNNGLGVELYQSSNNIINGNNVTNNEIGILLFESSNNSISGNNVTANSQHGIYLTISSNNSISGNNVTANNWDGISLRFGCMNNSITGNNVAGNNAGIYLLNSSNNTVSGNTITNNTENGIEFRFSINNSICGNNIRVNKVGVYILLDSSNNKFYHNNFVDNIEQVISFDSTNFWDKGYPSGGNYWSDYTGVDLNHDGIGDTPHVIDENNTDYHPLMGSFNSFGTSVGKSVNVISNSTIETFEYCQPCKYARIHVSNTTSNQTYGFCRISIPYEVLSPPFSVTIDGANPTYWNYTLYDNGTHRWIYFAYEHSTLEIIIVPEFPSFQVLPLFMIATILAVILYRRKHST